MNAAFVSNEANCNQHNHYNQNDSLFVFAELENPEESLHSIGAKL